jgi:hypothetical protein
MNSVGNVGMIYENAEANHIASWAKSLAGVKNDKEESLLW